MNRHFQSILEQQKKDLKTVLINLDPTVQGGPQKRLELQSKVLQIQSILDRLEWDKPYYFDEDTVKPRCKVHKVALKKAYQRGVSNAGNYPYDPIPGWWACPECPSDDRLKYVPLDEESPDYWDTCNDCEQLVHLDNARYINIDGESLRHCPRCWNKRR